MKVGEIGSREVFERAVDLLERPPETRQSRPHADDAGTVIDKESKVRKGGAELR